MRIAQSNFDDVKSFMAGLEKHQFKTGVEAVRRSRSSTIRGNEDRMVRFISGEGFQISATD
jgi:hypothetical protein